MLMPDVKTPNDEKALEDAARELSDVLDGEHADQITMEPIFADRFYFGLAGVGIDKQRFPRVLDMGRRFAFVLAACNGATEVDEEMAALAVRFVDYQIAACERLMPDDASNPVQAFENRIIRFFERQMQKAREEGRDWQGATQREVRNYIKPENSPGGHTPYNRAFESLTRSGKLKQVTANRVGKEIWKLDD